MSAVRDINLSAFPTSEEADLVDALRHPSCYPRFGFTRASRAGIRLSIEVPDEALMVLSLDATRALPGGLVTYAPPFGI